MSKVLNALFDQEEDAEDNTEIEMELVHDDGQNEEVEEEVSEDTPEDETEVAEDEEPSEKTADETGETVESKTEEEAEADPKVEKAVEAAEGRLAGMLAQRERAQKAERELEAANERLRAYERQQAQFQAQNLPDPNNDPYGYAEALREQYERASVEQRFHYSDQMARTKYGAEKVEEAAIWATAHIQTNPGLRDIMFAQPDPLGWVVEQFEENQFNTKLRTDPDALFKEWAERNGYKPADSNPAPVAKAPRMPAATNKQTQAAPKRAAAASLAAPGKRGGDDAPATVLGALGLKN